MNVMSKHNWAVKDVVDNLLLVMPGVSSGKMFGCPGYRVNGKVFTFVGGSGVAVKLPAARVAALIGTADVFQPFHPGDGTVVWKEWLSIQRPNPADYAQDIALFEESLLYVTGG